MRGRVAALAAVLVMVGCPPMSRADDGCGVALENYAGTFLGDGEYFSIEVVIAEGKATTKYSGLEDVTFEPVEVEMFDFEGLVGIEWSVDYGDFFGFDAACSTPPEVADMTLLTPDNDVVPMYRATLGR